jgi:hypothetical protein
MTKMLVPTVSQRNISWKFVAKTELVKDGDMATEK